MSQGTPIRYVRIPKAEWLEILRTVEFRNHNSLAEDWTVSDFIRIACAEKIRKMDRSRGRVLTIMDEIIELTEFDDPHNRERYLFDTLENP